MATKHTYHTGTYSGKTLHVLSTPASNIRLYNLKGTSSLINSAYYGINGGFFSWDSNKALNIALSDGAAIGPGDVGTDNNWAGGGVISWNGVSVKFNAPIQEMGKLDEDVRSGQSGTWAQGGHSMYLGNKNWLSKMYGDVLQTVDEHNPDLDKIVNNSSYRTGLVADKTTKMVHLVVTLSGCTFSTFRAAIQSYLGISDGSSDSTRYVGLFLDGSYSSQMKAKNTSNNVITVANLDSGAYRKLHQIIVLRSAT